MNFLVFNFKLFGIVETPYDVENLELNLWNNYGIRNHKATDRKIDGHSMNIRYDIRGKYSINKFKMDPDKMDSYIEMYNSNKDLCSTVNGQIHLPYLLKSKSEFGEGSYSKSRSFNFSIY